MYVASERSTQLERGDGAIPCRKMAVVTVRCKVMVEKSPQARGRVWLLDLVLFFAFDALLVSSCRNIHVESGECQSLLTMTLFSVPTFKKYQVMFLGNQTSEPLTKSLGFM